MTLTELIAELEYRIARHRQQSVDVLLNTPELEKEQAIAGSMMHDAAADALEGVLTLAREITA